MLCKRKTFQIMFILHTRRSKCTADRVKTFSQILLLINRTAHNFEFSVVRFTEEMSAHRGPFNTKKNTKLVAIRLENL